MDSHRFDDALFLQLQQAFASEGRSGSEKLLLSLKGSFASAGDELAASCSVDFLDFLVSKRNADALDALKRAFAALKSLPESLLTYGMYAAIQTNRRAELAWPLFHFAERAVDEGRFALALEFVKKVYNVAYSGYDAEFLVKGERLTQVAALLERIAKASPREATPPLAPERKTKPRVALISVNMLDGVSAYAKRASQFSRHVDRSLFDCYEYFVEETLTERTQHSLFKLEQPSSEQNAPKALAAMRAEGAVVKFVPKELDWLEGSLWLAAELERDSIDGAIFQGGVGSPMLWLASRLASIPRKITLCVGVNMFQTGQFATVYMGNKSNMERDAAFWRPEWGRQILLDGGVDVDEAARALPLSRKQYMIPDGAVAFGFLSNYPAQRAASDYMSCVARILKACPNALFVCMGPGRPDSQMAFMKNEGLAGRCRWLLWQHQDSFASLKLLDFYLNEFPVGGAQVVLESMACGVPALAMAWSEKHAECAGASLLGPDFAVANRDLDAYVARAVEWARNPDARQAASKIQRARAEKLHSAKNFIGKLCELAAKGKI